MSGGGADEGGGTWSRHYRRPYTVTGGRTRPAHDDLELETLVRTVTFDVVSRAWAAAPSSPAPSTSR